MKNFRIDEIISKRSKIDGALDSAKLIDKLLSKPKDNERLKRIVEANVKNLELTLNDTNIVITPEQSKEINTSIERGNSFIKPVGEIKHIMSTGSYMFGISVSGELPTKLFEMSLTDEGNLVLDFLIFRPGLSLNIVLSPTKDGFSLSATINEDDLEIGSLNTESIQFDKQNRWLAESIKIDRSLYDIVIDYKPIKTSPEEVEPKK